MKDEIKEILEYLNNDNYFNENPEYEVSPYDLFKSLNSVQTDKLLDYITNLQQENQKLKSELECYENGVYFSSKVEELERENERLKEYSNQLESNYDLMLKNNDNKLLMYYKSRCEKAIEYIKKDTRWFDSEYAKVYGELCSCAGANANRLEILVNPSNLLNILNDRSDK